MTAQTSAALTATPVGNTDHPVPNGLGVNFGALNAQRNQHTLGMLKGKPRDFLHNPENRSHFDEDPAVSQRRPNVIRAGQDSV